MSYSGDYNNCKIQTRDREIITDPGAQNTFLVVFKSLYMFVWYLHSIGYIFYQFS